MSDYRYQPLTDQWVLMAGNRQQRPSEYQQQQSVVCDRPCPFCLGHEEETPEAVSTYPSYPPESDWSVRVFPNKYPALDPTPNQAPIDCGPYTHFQGFGIHELVVLSPRHVESFSELTPEERELSFVAFQDRLRNAYASPSIQHAIVFQNCRLDAGASIQHVHCQLIGTTVVPPLVAQRSQRQLDYRREHGHSLLQAIIETELQSQSRLIAVTEQWVAFCPFASRLPYEIWVGPRFPDQFGNFLRLSRPSLSALAQLVQQIVQRLESVMPQVAYNTVIHVPPRSQESEEDPSGWFVEIFPRINKTAGFEWATGCMINQVPPETAALRLRNN